MREAKGYFTFHFQEKRRALGERDEGFLHLLRKISCTEIEEY